MARLRRPISKVTHEKYAKGEGHPSFTLEKYLARNQDKTNHILSISEFLENPKSLVRVQSYDLLKNYKEQILSEDFIIIVKII